MKVRLTIETNVRYQSEIIVEQPETMPDEDFEAILDNVERSCRTDNVEDVASVLEVTYGIKLLDIRTGFPDSPDYSDLEITDVENV